MIICQPYRQNHQEEQQRSNETVQPAQNKRNRRSKNTYASDLMKKKNVHKNKNIKAKTSQEFLIFTNYNQDTFSFRRAFVI